MTCVRPSAPSGRSPGGPRAGANPRVRGMRRRKAGSSNNSSCDPRLVPICLSRSPRERSRDRLDTANSVGCSVTCAPVCRSVRSVCAGTDARAPFVSAFARTDWTDGQMLGFCPVVSCVCADVASVSRSVRTSDDRTDATDRRGVPRLLLPCLVLLGGLAGGGSVGGA